MLVDQEELNVSFAGITSKPIWKLKDVHAMKQLIGVINLDHELED